MTIVFSGEYVNAETGDEEQLHAISLGAARKLINKMREGDALVLNAHEGPQPGEVWTLG